MLPVVLSALPATVLAVTPVVRIAPLPVVRLIVRQVFHLIAHQAITPVLLGLLRCIISILELAGMVMGA